MKIAGRSILLAALLTCLLSGNAGASTSSVADNLSNRTILSQPRDPSFNFLLAQQAVDSTQLQTSPSLKRKSPYMAIFYSFIPGIIVHGSGHFYAGDARTGSRLLGAEAAGGLLIVGGFFLGLAGVQTEAGFAVLSGGILFVGSWVYDVVRSPLVVKKHNKELLERKQGQLRFRTKDRDLRLELVWRF
jgi:hypothetical protein